MFDHTERIKKLLADGKLDEARQVHLQRVDEQLEIATSEPIDLTDLISANEAFVLHDIDKQERRLVQASKEEFEEFIRRHNLVPDGFHSNGGYTQTRFLDANAQERARLSSDLSETIYEIEG